MLCALRAVQHAKILYLTEVLTSTAKVPAWIESK
jgi:hypothetical protein